MYTLPKNLRYPDPQGCFILGSDGEAKWLSTPFQAIPGTGVGSLRPYSTITVEEVAYTPSNELIYIINGKAYYMEFFIVIDS